MARDDGEQERDEQREAEERSPRAELKSRRRKGWAVALGAGLPLFALMASPEKSPHAVLFGIPLLLTTIAGVLHAVGALRRVGADEELPPFAKTPFGGDGDEPTWMQPRITFPVAAVLLLGIGLIGGYANLPVAFVVALLALLPSAVNRPGLLVMIAVGLVYLPLLGTYVLWDPWETHYGEVAREIVERDDWISLWWAQEKWFWSKPILIFWNEALWLNALGVDTSPDSGALYTEWAIRLPVMVQSLAAVAVVYLTMKRIYSERAGALAALVMATCPHFFFLAHQAITDMYLVANLVMAVCMLALAFATDPEKEVTEFRLFGFAVSMQHIVLGGIMALVLPQALYLVSRNLAFFPWEGFGFQADEFLYGSAGNDAIPGNPEHAIQYPAVGGDAARPFPEDWGARFAWMSNWLAQPIAQGIYWLIGLAGIVLYLRRQKRAQALAMMGFYVFCALAFMGKGIPGIALPGLVALFYLVASRRWNVLLDGQLRVAPGILVVLSIGLPWYVAMYMRHGDGFTDRLLVHDHLNRLASGVHGDKGSIEYFLEQLGFGTFPWVGLIPAAVLAWLWMRHRDAGPRGQAMPEDPEQKKAYHQRETMMLLGLWFFSAFTLFSAMITKFHHYIFPAVPPAAVMVGLLLDRLWGPAKTEGAAKDEDETPRWHRWAATALAMAGPAALVAGIGGLVGDLRGAIPEGVDEAGAKEWVLDHPMNSALSYGLVALGAAALAFAARWLWRQQGEDEPSPAQRRADLGLSAAVGAGAVLVAFVARDLSWVTSARPWGYERLIHLFVYNYERAWPAWFDYRPILTGFGVTAGLIFLGAMSRYARPMATRALIGLALLFSAWTVNVYMIDLSPHWGMGEVFEMYYDMREGPEEPIVAWQMNWKGENFYTGNRVRAFVDLDNVKIREWIEDNRGITAYFVLEYSRLGSFRSLLRGREVEEITDKRVNNKFLMVRVEGL